MLKTKSIKLFFKDAESVSNGSKKLPDLEFEKPKNNRENTQTSSFDDEAFTKQFIFKPDIIVYTDGACIHNGKPNAKAGMGVYFGKDDPRNLSKRVDGKQTNNNY